MNQRTRMGAWPSGAARVALASALYLMVSACVGTAQVPDGGTDAGVPDAGVPDSGVPDSGVPDAGVPDAGPPPELKILEVLPPRGPSAGGVQVILRGSGFVNGVANRATEATTLTSLKFGSNSVQSFQVIDDETIDARVPPGNPGPTSVTVENANGRFICAGCFTYFEELFLRTATPKEGPLRGDTEVTLTGAGFTPDVQVLFGGQSAPAVSVASATSMKVRAPRAVTAGAVDITVYSKNGLGVLRRAYRYYDDLRVSTVAPLTGPVAGATTVVIAGKGFDGATSVVFGGVPAASFTVNSSTQITAVTPPGASAGAIAVEIVTPGDRWVARDVFSYVTGSGFAVYGVFPHVGPATGGNVVTVTGEGLGVGNLAITFGGQAATLLAATNNEARVSVPPRGAASRKVNVAATAGAQSALRSEGYTYGIALADIAPRSGPIAGGTVVTLTGTGLPGTVAVNIGAGAAPVQAQVGETAVELVTPQGQGGSPTDVWARDTSDPENEAFLEDVFTFDEPISVGRVQPGRGAIAGGTLITVLGSGFGEATLVRFGGNVAKDIKVIDPHTLSCRTPRGDVGVVDVKVSRSGREDTLSGGFSYYDPRSISGGLSGGPLLGTLNVSVLDSTPGFFGAAVPLAAVMLGTDPFTPFQGLTDNRGQVTFSDPSLVKPQTVTAFKQGYENATVTSVSAENLTVFIARTSGDGDPSPPPPPSPASVISGKVTGFKAPRPLGPNETLEARVFIAQRSLFSGAPFAPPPDRFGQKWQVREDGGEYLLFSGAGLRATYAVLGVWNGQTRSFEPYLMGIRRGITVTSDQPATDENIVLDMHLDQAVSVTVDSPISFGGSPAPNELYAWLDLGAEGFIPNPHNWSVARGIGAVGPGSGDASSIVSTSASLSFPSFPQLDGSNFIFMNLSLHPSGLPQSVFFRRQPGDLSQTGVTIGPMLPTPTFLSPAGTFTGMIQWAADPGPAPDIHNVLIVRSTMFGDVTVWSIVLPGSETQLVLPPTAVEKLREEEAGNKLFVQIFSSRSPKFSYNQWTYDALSGVTWSSFTIAESLRFFP
jgi:hypothetical protein